MRVNSGLDLSLVAVRISESGNGYIKKIKNHITLDIFIYRLMHNVFCVVAPPPPHSVKKIIIHEIIHEILSIYILFSTN